VKQQRINGAKKYTIAAFFLFIEKFTHLRSPISIFPLKIPIFVGLNNLKIN